MTNKQNRQNIINAERRWWRDSESGDDGKIQPCLKEKRVEACGSAKISRRRRRTRRRHPGDRSHFRGGSSASRGSTAEVDERDVTLSRWSRVNVEEDQKNTWRRCVFFFALAARALCWPLVEIAVASYLLLVAQEVGELVGGQVILPVAVGHHQQEDVPSQGHHLVEDGKLLVGQRTLLVVGVGLLRANSRGEWFYEDSANHRGRWDSSKIIALIQQVATGAD